MMRVGFIDYYLDEWHANHYPIWIREQAQRLGLPTEVVCAWADIDSPSGGLTTAQWCEQHQIRQAETQEQLIEQVDCLIVLSPDNPEQHERLSELALRAGKPVYMDKTFAPDAASAQRMFALAQQFSTPLFSSSALRYSSELLAWKQQADSADALKFVATSGPGSYDNYAVHQLEMIVTLLGTGAERIKSVFADHGHGRLFAISYPDGRQASLLQASAAEFQVNVQSASGQGHFIGNCSHFFNHLIAAIIRFFHTGQLPVRPEETIEIITLLEGGRHALRTPDQWISLAGRGE